MLENSHEKKEKNYNETLSKSRLFSHSSIVFPQIALLKSCHDLTREMGIFRVQREKHTDLSGRTIPQLLEVPQCRVAFLKVPSGACCCK